MCIRGTLTATHIAILNLAAKLVLESFSDLIECVSFQSIYFASIRDIVDTYCHTNRYTILSCTFVEILHFWIFLIRLCAFTSILSESVHEDPAWDLADPDAIQWLCCTILRQGFHNSLIRSALDLSDLLCMMLLGSHLC